jgi:rhamnogalacturonan endolyase
VREGVNDILVFTQDRDLYCSKMVSLCHLQVLLLSCLLLRFAPVHGFLNATEDAKALVIANDHLYASVNKSTGIMDVLTLDGQNLLGTKEYNEVTPGGNAAGQNGIGPYLDCYCVPSGAYTPGKYATFKLFSGNDSTGVSYGGVVMSEVYPLTGQILEQYWFLRESETGLHTFSRLAYHNETKPFLRLVNVQYSCRVRWLIFRKKLAGVPDAV